MQIEVIFIFDKMVDLSEFESISPYTDAEAAEALGKLAEYPLLAKVSQQFFPEESPDFLKNILKNIKTNHYFCYIIYCNCKLKD